MWSGAGPGLIPATASSSTHAPAPPRGPPQSLDCALPTHAAAKLRPRALAADLLRSMTAMLPRVQALSPVDCSTSRAVGQSKAAWRSGRDGACARRPEGPLEDAASVAGQTIVEAADGCSRWTSAPRPWPFAMIRATTDGWCSASRGSAGRVTTSVTTRRRRPHHIESDRVAERGRRSLEGVRRRQWAIRGVVRIDLECRL